ncbi:MAG TPA: glycosyltransferase, partial [Sphingomonas sp.]|nr:glycosyltransferase [Sphingomonas sp.]
MADKKERWNDETPAVLIFTRLLLPLSQTFIKHHAESMFRFRPIMLAWHQSDELRMDGVTQHIVSQTALSKILLYYFGYSRQIAAIVRRYNIQIVHCHFADQAVLMARFAKRQHLPLVVTLHGSDILRRRAPSAMGKFKERLTRHMVDSAALFLPVSAWLHEQAIRLGYPRDRMRLHYLGIPLQQVGDDRRATAVTPTILHVGRLVEKKGLLYLLEAIRILKARGVACKVRVVG